MVISPGSQFPRTVTRAMHHDTLYVIQDLVKHNIFLSICNLCIDIYNTSIYIGRCKRYSQSFNGGVIMKVNMSLQEKLRAKILFVTATEHDRPLDEIIRVMRNKGISEQVIRETVK